MNKLKRTHKVYHKIKLSIDQHSWKAIEFPSHKKDWKKFELNNKSMALNVLYVPYKTEKIEHLYKSKHNFNLNSFNDSYGKKWHYLALKNYLHCLEE